MSRDLSTPRELPRLMLPAIALVSATGLAAEIILMRAFSIIEWHQFAWVIISLALLGFGASGTLLVLLRDRVMRNHRAVATALPALAAMTFAGSLSIATRIEWRSLELLWNPSQTLRLFAIYLLLAIPFCCVGMFIGLTFMRWPRSIGQLYGADLGGAALGAILAILLLTAVHPSVAWIVLCGLAIAASIIVSLQLGPRMIPIPLVGGAVTAVVISAFPPLVTPGEYKAITQTLRVPGAQVLETRSGPLGFLQLLENERVPLRLAPGLSLNHFEELPLQRGVYVDGEGPVILNRTDAPLDHIDRSVIGAIFSLDRTIDSALISGTAGLPELVRLAQRNTTRMTLIEDDPQLARLVTEASDWGGDILQSQRVDVMEGELRSLLPRLEAPVDLVFVPFSPNESLNPSSQVTVEAFDLMLSALSDSGIIAIRTSVETPPRTVPVLLATIAEALENRGLDPARHIAAIRGWDAAAVIVSRPVLERTEIRGLREFARKNSFDLFWLPDIEPADVNRFNRVDEPWYYESAREILAGPVSRAAFSDRYKFDIRPPVDDRPWFGMAMPWSTLLELIRLRDEGGVALVRTGYPLLLLTLAQAIVAGLVLILLPLTLLDRGEREGAGIAAWRVVVTFASLGVAFLLLEIVYIHRLTVFLGRPLESTTIVLASFLFFTGLGSIASAKRRARNRDGPPPAATLIRSCLLVALISVLEIPILSLGADLLSPLPHWLRVTTSVTLIAPLAFAMGIPFPCALEILRRHANERWIAWAWGINGCASVVSAVLAVLLALHLGLTAVSLIAALLYVLAGLAGRADFQRRSLGIIPDATR